LHLTVSAAGYFSLPVSGHIRLAEITSNGVLLTSIIDNQRGAWSDMYEEPEKNTY
jgi:hypothetical protein